MGSYAPLDAARDASDEYVQYLTDLPEPKAP